MNSKKTKVFERKAIRMDVRIVVDNVVLKEVDQFEFLKIGISKGDRFTAYIERRGCGRTE